MVALLVFIIATLEIIFGRKKKCWTQKVHLAIPSNKSFEFLFSSLTQFFQ